MVGLGIFALAAIGCALYGVSAGPGAGYAIPGAILMLSAGQLVAVVAATWRTALLENRVRQETAARRLLEDDYAGMSERLDAVEQRLDNPPKTPLDEIAAEVRALRDGVAKLASRPVPEPAPYPQPAPRAAPSFAAAPAATQDRLDLLLEPVIELSTGATAHYRVQLNLTNEAGAAIAHDELMAKADQGGMREALDVHALKQAAPVLRKLRVRNPGTRVFVPLGAGTLASPTGVAKLRETLLHEADVTSGLVFEIPQDVLAALSAEGITHLAELGRTGITLGLSNVAVAGLDLQSLKQLGVKFLGINAASFDGGFGVSPSWREFTQYARAMQFQVMATRVGSAGQATASAQLARYASGLFFAPARKVKTDAGVPQPLSRARAA